MKELLKKIIKAVSAYPEKIVLWLFLFVLVAMGSYLIVRWHAKEPPVDLIPAARPAPEALVLVDFSGLMMEEGSYLRDFPRDPFSHQPLVPEQVPEQVQEVVPEQVQEVVPEQIAIIIAPRPRLTEMMTIGGRRVAFIRIGRETHRITGGEDINGWKVLNIEADRVALYNEKKGQRLTLFIIH